MYKKIRKKEENRIGAFDSLLQWVDHLAFGVCISFRSVVSLEATYWRSGMELG